MSRSHSVEPVMPAFGGFLWLAFDWIAGALSPPVLALNCPCSDYAPRRVGCTSDRPTGLSLTSSSQTTTQAYYNRQRRVPSNNQPLSDGRGTANTRAGFTLVEMLVVLLILAALTVAAVQSLSPVADQARYDSTSRTLTQLEEAMLGANGLRQSDGTPLITGFVADVGRVPVLQGSDAETQLSELWNSTSTLATTFPFQTRLGPAAPTDYSAVRLPCGWRGPYLQLGVGVTDLRDGWATPFSLTPNTAGSSLTSVTWNFVSPYSDNLTISATPGLVTVSGTLTNNNAVPGAATIVLLYPDPSLSTTTLSVMTDADATVGGFQFNNVPIGFRVLHATIDGNVLIKYLQVPRTGLSLNVNYQP